MLGLSVGARWAEGLGTYLECEVASPWRNDLFFLKMRPVYSFRETTLRKGLDRLGDIKMVFTWRNIVSVGAWNIWDYFIMRILRIKMRKT